VLLKFDIDFLRLCAVGPVEDAGLKWISFEDTLFFTVSLDYLNGLVSLVNDHISWLELDDLGKTERIWQVLNISNNLIHAICTELAQPVLQENGFSLEFGLVKGEVSPI
jgi:hypothetical protein